MDQYYSVRPGVEIIPSLRYCLWVRITVADIQFDWPLCYFHTFEEANRMAIHHNDIWKRQKNNLYAKEVMNEIFGDEHVYLNYLKG